VLVRRSISDLRFRQGAFTTSATTTPTRTSNWAVIGGRRTRRSTSGITVLSEKTKAQPHSRASTRHTCAACHSPRPLAVGMPDRFKPSAMACSVIAPVASTLMRADCHGPAHSRAQHPAHSPGRATGPATEFGQARTSGNNITQAFLGVGHKSVGTRRQPHRRRNIVVCASE
jgi:hypothetical protein